MTRLLPGLALCVAIAIAARGLQAVEVAWLGRAWVDSLVLAILVGTVVRSGVDVPARANAGIDFAAKPVLEVAIVLLGLTLDVPLLLRAGPLLLVVIVGAVAIALAGGYLVGRWIGLSPTLALLVATGNAICGNSAIAAAAPVVGADAREVAAAIAYTAVLGVVVVLLLPLAGAMLALSDYDYGVVAGLTVYAVPQVLAATLPVSALSGEVGTLVKLVRVLMLGPVLTVLGILARRRTDGTGATQTGARGALVPWFVVGFLALAVLRGVGGVPDLVVAPARDLSRLLTIVALAALGLGVDVRALRSAGPAVVAAAGTGLLLLFGIATLLVRVLP